MSWAKVNKTNRMNLPLGWWFHKVMCEVGWMIRYRNHFRMYYKHLHALCKYGYNLYGDKLP